MSNLGTRNFLFEQGPPPGGNPMAAMMGGMGGQQEPKSDEDMVWEKLKSYPKIDVFIQQMQQQNYADSVILDEIYSKFYPEIVYFVKEILTANSKPTQQGGMPGMPGMGQSPMGAGGQ